MNDLKVEKKLTQKKYQKIVLLKALNSFIQKINSPAKKEK